MTDPRIGRQSRTEFIALQAAITAILAVATDVMLPAFGAISDRFALDQPGDVAVIVTVFFAGLGIGQFMYGPISDRFGRKPVLLAGIAIYAAAALSSALAPSFEWIIVSRFVWGLGAAAPRTVSNAIVRDRFEGDAMTKVLSVVFAVFMIVPAIGPLFGQMALEFGSWRWTFGLGFVTSAAVAVWTIFRLDESHPRDRRRPLNVGSIGEAVRQTLRTRSAMGNMIAFAFTMAMLIAYLGAIQPMFDELYGEGERFPLWFALGAVTSAGAATWAARAVDRLGTNRVAMIGLRFYWVLGCVFLAACIAADGLPSFPVFLTLTTLLIGCHAGSSPLLNSLAMRDVGQIAGTASATIGTISFVLGSLLATPVTALVGTSITPFAVAYVTLIGLAWATAWFTNSRETAPAA